VHYVAYLLDLTTTRVVDGSVEHAPSPMLPSNGFAWKIVCDTAGTVVVRGMVNNRVVPLATARWTDSLVERKQRDADAVNEHQWALVETTLRERLAIASSSRPAPIEPILEPSIDLDHLPEPVSPERASEIDARLRERRRAGKPQAAPASPSDKQVAPGWHARNRSRKRWELVSGITVGGGLIALFGYAIYADHCRSSSKPEDKAVVTKAVPIDAAVAKPLTIDQRVAAAPSLPEALALAKPISTPLVARYAVAKLRFAEVDATETTLALVEKDFKAELGKRMCATGEIRRIERADMDNRKVFVGELMTKEQDRVTFLAVGTTGDLVKRSTARFCGVVTDKLQLVGMFDLPENRAPAVEQ
jgi:hypothetical protein